MQELFDYIDELEKIKYIYKRKQDVNIDKVLEDLIRLNRYAKTAYEHLLEGGFDE